MYKNGKERQYKKMIIQRILKKIYLKMCSNEQYIEYLRKKGAKIGKGCDIHKNVNIDNEAYMIYIGNNTRITSGVRLIPHDGGLWTLRKMGLLPPGKTDARNRFRKNKDIPERTQARPDTRRYPQHRPDGPAGTRYHN